MAKLFMDVNVCKFTHLQKPSIKNVLGTYEHTSRTWIQWS